MDDSDANAQKGALTTLITGLLDELHTIARSESVVGKPIQFGEAHLAPLSKVTIGFGTGTGDLRGGGRGRDGRFDAGGAAGGLVVEPRGFVVVAKDGIPQLLAMRGGNATLKHAVMLPEHEAEDDARPAKRSKSGA